LGRELVFFAESKHSQYLRTQPSEYAGFRRLADGKREREMGRGESIHPSTPMPGLLNGIPYDDWWREREGQGKGRKKIAF
jgi:hypothetical protein